MTAPRNDLLDAFGNVIGAIKAAQTLPGVDLVPYLTTVQSAIDVARRRGAKCRAVTDLKNTFAGGLPTVAQREALDARIAEGT